MRSRTVIGCDGSGRVMGTWSGIGELAAHHGDDVVNVLEIARRGVAVVEGHSVLL